MEINEKIELVLIFSVGMVVFLSSKVLPFSISFARLTLLLAAILLLHSLIRDLWILSKRSQEKTPKPKEARCMCMESTIGMTGVIFGLVCLMIGYDHILLLSGFTWSLLITLVLIIGFLSKDYVFSWNPLKLYKEKNHMNIIFKWKN